MRTVNIVTTRTSWARRLLSAATVIVVAAAAQAGPFASPASAAKPVGPHRQQDKPVPVSPLAATPPVKPNMPLWQPPVVAWPSAGTATVTLTAASGSATAAGAATVGGLATTVRSQVPASLTEAQRREARLSRFDGGMASAVGGVSATRVVVYDQAAAQRAGVRGVLLSISRADDATSRSSVEVSLDYAKFAAAYGGNWGERLRLVTMPACALTTPDLAACQQQTPLSDSHNDVTTSTVTAPVVIGGATLASSPARADDAPGPGEAVLALTADASGDSGTWSATSFNQQYTWTSGGNSGDFATSIPIAVPPVPGEFKPEVRLAYTSGMVDGLTKSTNTQAPWLGEGWDYDPGYIERPYRMCHDDGNPTNPGDYCFVSKFPVSVVLNGHSTRIMDNSGNGYKAEDDSLGWKIEYLTGASNGVWNGEYFRITTMDGTQYTFGGRARGSNGGTLRTVVYSNNTGEPCKQSTFAASQCWMGYRWQLETVTDRFGNTIEYNYGIYSGKYGANNNTAAYEYDIYGWLAWIDYGSNINVAGTHASARVKLNIAYRCLSTPATCDSNPSLWPDVPWDQRCELWATSCPGRLSPTYWGIYRLASITTHVWDPTLNNGAGAMSDTPIDTWTLTHSFPSTGDFISPAGDDTSPSLWLQTIQRTGMPATNFYGTQLKNRVFWGNDLNRAPMTHYRLGQINSGSGETIAATYSPEECTRTNVYDGASDHNPRRCFPQWEVDQTRWYHKFVATDVTVTDTTGGAPAERWHYDYSTDNATSLNGAGWEDTLWHYDYNWMPPASQRNFSLWRGYVTVRTTHGAPDGSGPQQVTEDIYYRGMDGDKTTAGGFGTRRMKIDDGWDHEIVDSEWFAGRLRRTMTFDGPTGTWTSAERHIPTANTTGGQYMGGGTPDLVATRVVETQTIRNAVMAAGPPVTYRVTETDTEYHATYPIPTKVSDLGDLADGSDDRCTSISYVNPDTTKWLVDFPSQTLTTTCATNPGTGDYLAGTQTLYDNSSTVGATPTRGAVTKTLALATASTAPPSTSDWKQSSRASYDTIGRILDSFDALDHQTTTAYMPSLTGPATSVAVTGPMGAGWTITTTLDPARGQPIKVVDSNGKVTLASYDTATGRLLKVWKNNRATSLPTSITPDVEYGYLLRDNGSNWISTTVLGPDHTESVPQRLTSYQLFDGRLRVRQSQAPSPSGGSILTDTRYSPIGLPAKQSKFHAYPGVPGDLYTFDDAGVGQQTRLVYDNLGRTTYDQTWSWGSKLWETTYGYDGEKTVTMTPPSGGTATTSIVNARGKITELRQHQGGTPAGLFDSTFYGYDRLDRLTSVTDTLGNQWTYTFDRRGRQTQVRDPDNGTETFTYDDTGAVLTSTNANNQTLAYIYDALGRKTELHDTSPTGALRAKWFYNTTNAKGQLDSVARYDATGSYTASIGSYNDAYQPLTVTYSIPGFGPLGGPLSYTVTSTYKANGAIATQAMPAVGSGTGAIPAETITHTYGDISDAAAEFTMASNLATYVAEAYPTWDGKPGELLQGSAPKRLDHNFYYNGVGRLEMHDIQQWDNSFARMFFDIYSYDPAGNLTSVEGRVGPSDTADQKDCYQYDDLRRLQKAWTQVTGACTTPQRTGPAPYWREWTYDKIGNRQTQVDKDPVAGDTTWTSTIPASGTNSVRPHSITAVAGTGPKAGAARNFTFDNAGNTLTRTTETGASQTLTWDPEGNLTQIVQGANTHTNVYDAEGNRIVSTDPTGSTLYLPDGTEIKKSTGGQLDATRYYTFHGIQVAVRKGNTMTWVYADHHGTATAQIDPTTLTTTRKRSLPFGEPNGTPPTFLGSKGFVGGTADPTELTRIGARDYDATLGRFLSQDTVTNNNDPQQINGYSYANNNPTSLADTTGRYPCCWNPNGAYTNKYLIRRPGTPHDLFALGAWIPIFGDAFLEWDAELYDSEGNFEAAQKQRDLILDNNAIPGEIIVPPALIRLLRPLFVRASVQTGERIIVMDAAVTAGRYESGRVEYATTGLSKIALGYRARVKTSVGQNVAVFVVDTGGGKAEVVIAPNIPDGADAEQIIARLVDDPEHKIDRLKVIAIYTEKEPCGPRRQDCSKLIRDTFPNATVSWSFRTGENQRPAILDALWNEKLGRI